MLAAAAAAALITALSLFMRRRRAHQPRALALTLALPPTLAEQVHRGRATIKGECTRCHGPWETCERGCVTRPPPLPIPGPGWRRIG